MIDIYTFTRAVLKTAEGLKDEYGESPSFVAMFREALDIAVNFPYLTEEQIQLSLNDLADQGNLVAIKILGRD